MKISRQVGTASEILNIFVQDATVTTGAGLANIVASSVRAYWLRNDATGISSTTMTSAALVGTFSSGGWVQVNSNSTLGWYQFGIPNAALASGRSTLLHLSAAPSMAPVPIEIELTKTDNQTYVSSQSHNIELIYDSPIITTAAGVPSIDQRTILGSTPVTSAAGRYTISGTTNISSVPLVGVSTITVPVGVTTFAVPVGVSSFAIGVSVSSLYGSALVTSAAGIQTINVRDIHGSAAVTSAAGTYSVNQLTILGSTPLTSAAGRYTVSGTTNISSVSLVGVSTLSVSVGVSSFAGSAVVTTEAGVVATAIDWGRTANPNSTVAFSSVSFSSVPATVAGVNVTSVAGSAVVTSAAGVLSARLDASGSAALTEGYAALGATGTLPQLLYEIRSLLAEKVIVGTSMTTRKLDGAATAEVFTFDSSTAPLSVTRAS